MTEPKCVLFHDNFQNFKSYSERMFMPDRTYFLAPELTELGGGEQPSSCPNGCLFLMTPLSSWQNTTY